MRQREPRNTRRENVTVRAERNHCQFSRCLVREGREGGKEGVSEGGREGGREGERKVGREGGRERGRSEGGRGEERRGMVGEKEEEV